MIIPIRCFTCGKVVADKWKYYSEKVKEQENKQDEKEKDKKEPKQENFQAGFKKEILDELGLEKMCCRRQVLCHVNLLEII